MSLDRVREVLLLGRDWGVVDEETFVTFDDALSDLTTHEKEDEERERREEELDSLLADERENSKELATQLQELLEAAKGYIANPSGAGVFRRLKRAIESADER